MLETFPRGAALAVLAPPSTRFAEIVGERGDAATQYVGLTGTQVPAHPALAMRENILLEGLDAVVDPVALLRGLAATAPEARLFALVANAAHFGALAAFYAGKPLGDGHPLVINEIGPLLTIGGWRTITINSIFDETIGAQAPPPVDLNLGSMRFHVTDEQMLARGRVHAFVAIAEPS